MHTARNAHVEGVEEVLLPARTSQLPWDDDEALLLSLPLQRPNTYQSTPPAALFHQTLPTTSSLYDLLPPQELLWSQPAQLRMSLEYAPSQHSLPAVRSFPSLASRQRTSLEESTMFWDDYIKAGMPLARSRSFHGIEASVLDTVPASAVPSVVPLSQRQQQRAFLDMLASQPAGGAIPAQPSMVSNSQLRHVMLSTEENQQIERESSAAIFFDNPARGMVPLPAPPPTPTSLNVFGGESDRGDENGMDTDMAADREDDVGDAAMQREMFGEYHGEALNTTRKGMATTDAMASSRAGGSNARAIGLGAPLTYTSSAPPPYRDTTAGAAAAYDARVLFAQVLSSMPPPPPPHHGTTARETDGSGVGTAGGGGIRGLPGRLMVRTASAPESRGPDNHTVNSPTAEMAAASRARCLERLRFKKLHRHSNKKIRYEQRKVNADKRPRFKGRFVKVMPAEDVPEHGAAEHGAAAEHGFMTEDDGAPGPSAGPSMEPMV